MFVGTDDDVVVINADTLDVAPFASGVSPSALAVDSGRGELYVAVADCASRKASWPDRRYQAHPRRPYPQGAGPGPCASSLTVMDSEDGSVISSYQVRSGQISALAVDSQRRLAYVADYDGATVWIVSLDRRTVSRAAPVGEGPVALAVAGDGRVYVASMWSDEGLTVLAAGGQQRTDALALRGQWLALSPDGRHLYVADFDTVTLLDVDTHQYTDSHYVLVPHEALGMALHPGTGRVFVASSEYWFGSDHGDVLSVLAPARSFAPGQRDPRGLIVGADGRLYAANFSGPSLSIIDPAREQLVAVELDEYFPTSVAVADHRHRAYISHHDGVLSVVDTASGTLLMEVQVAEVAGQLAIDGASGLVYVVDRWDDRIAVLGGEDLHEVASVAVGARPLMVAIDAVRRRLYVTNSGDATTSVLDIESHEVIATFDTPVGQWPAWSSVGSDLAVNTETGQLLVASGESVIVVHPLTGVELQRFVTSGPVREMSLDTTADRLYVASSSGMGVYDLESGRRLAEVETFGADSVAVDPIKGAVYIADGWGDIWEVGW